MRPRTDRHTDARDHNTLRVVYPILRAIFSARWAFWSCSFAFAVKCCVAWFRTNKMMTKSLLFFSKVLVVGIFSMCVQLCKGANMHALRVGDFSRPVLSSVIFVTKIENRVRGCYSWEILKSYMWFGTFWRDFAQNYPPPLCHSGEQNFLFFP